jgi:hypothetical protein
MAVTPTATSLFTNTDLPTTETPNGLIAPYWDDLQNVVICTKTIGAKVVVQWTGHKYNAATELVQFQAILDGATSTVEFVWGSGHVPTGDTATVGLEIQDGTAARKLGFNTANVTVPGTSVLLTP